MIIGIISLIILILGLYLVIVIDYEDKDYDYSLSLWVIGFMISLVGLVGLTIFICTNINTIINSFKI